MDNNNSEGNTVAAARDRKSGARQSVENTMLSKVTSSTRTIDLPDQSACERQSGNLKICVSPPNSVQKSLQFLQIVTLPEQWRLKQTNGNIKHISYSFNFFIPRTNVAIYLLCHGCFFKTLKLECAESPVFIFILSLFYFIFF